MIAAEINASADSVNRIPRGAKLLFSKTAFSETTGRGCSNRDSSETWSSALLRCALRSAFGRLPHSNSVFVSIAITASLNALLPLVWT